MPRPTSRPACERAGAPMSRPWARCAASTRAGGPWCSRAARASLWTTSPTSRCFRAGRKPGGPQKQAAQPGRLRRFCRDLLRARRAKERGRLCHGRGRAAPHRRERAGPGARGRRAHPSGRPLRPRAALERDGNQAVPQKTGGAAREAAPLLPRTISCPTRERAGAPMSRPWARCAASTRARGPWCSRAARASPWTTPPTSRCFRAERKPGGPQKQAAQPGRLRRFCRERFRAQRARRGLALL